MTTSIFPDQKIQMCCQHIFHKTTPSGMSFPHSLSKVPALMIVKVPKARSSLRGSNSPKRCCVFIALHLYLMKVTSPSVSPTRSTTDLVQMSVIRARQEVLNFQKSRLCPALGMLPKGPPQYSDTFNDCTF